MIICKTRNSLKSSAKSRDFAFLSLYCILKANLKIRTIYIFCINLVLGNSLCKAIKVDSGIQNNRFKISKEIQIMKKNMRWVLYICIFLLLIFFYSLGKTILADYIAENKNSWKPYYTDEKPDKIADKWFVPFKTKDRQDHNTIKIISVFGAHRNSYVKGHIHTGIDIIPENKRDYTYIDVYAMANGNISLDEELAPHPHIHVHKFGRLPHEHES